MHRIAISPRYSSGLVEIETQWSMADVETAHAVEDAIEAAEARAHAAAAKGSKR